LSSCGVFPGTHAENSPALVQAAASRAATVARLQQRAAAYQSQAYAQTSLKQVSTAMNSMTRFCEATGLWPDLRTGWSSATIALYVSFLAETVQHSTIRGYLSMGPRVFHLQRGLPWDSLVEDYFVQATLKGIRRHKGDARPNQKLALTVAHLMLIRRGLDPGRNLGHLAFWAALLVGFFGFLRKSNYLPEVRKDATGPHMLRRQDLSKDAASGRYWLTLTTTKTIQYRQRTLRLPLPSMPGHPLDPTAVLDAYMHVTRARPPLEFLFGTLDAHGQWGPILADRFVGVLRSQLTAAGVPDVTRFATHSLRRGGATFAMRIGVAPAVIKLLGDWMSECFYEYYSVDEDLREVAMELMADKLWAELAVGTGAGPSRVPAPGRS
jgi:hypothetical protein